MSLHQMADFDDSSRTLSNESVLSEDSVISDDDLSPEQIDALLKRASDRMKFEQTVVSRIATSVGKLPKLNSASLPPPYVRSDGQIARLEQKMLVSDAQRSLSEKPRKVVDPIVLRKETSRQAKDSLSDWYNLPKTDLTPELKRDLQLLNMRSVLDPKRMYKKQGKFKVPEYSQVGVIVEGPSEFHSARLQKKERKKTFVEEALAGEAKTGRFKRKYNEVQTAKTSGKKAFYKALKARRSKASKG